MFGNPLGEFRPQSNTTRAEMATILARTQLLNFERGVNTLPASMTTFNVFNDVTPDDWFYYYIAWSYDAGLVFGDAAGADGIREFRPNDAISRQEVAAMIMRLSTTILQANDVSAVTDWTLVSDWARNYVYSAIVSGAMIGDDAGAFRPSANISRAEVATAVNRTLHRVDGRDALDRANLQNVNSARVFPDVGESDWYFPSVLASANDHRLSRDSESVIIWMSILDE